MEMAIGGSLMKKNDFRINGSNSWSDYCMQMEMITSRSGLGGLGHYGIAEIPLAPNNTPTGTPTLTGDFKVGQTISIDASDIKDADNFEGWTPTYEYSWEVSGDNGTTWTALSSSDATDGDDSYTLTSAEVGKQLRGVVSYLDGYGTNETMESDGKTIESDDDIKIHSWASTRHRGAAILGSTPRVRAGVI